MNDIGGTEDVTARADQWLWAVRLFKTRSIAAKLCAAGKITRSGHFLKAGSQVRAGDVLEIPFPEGPGVRTVIVIRPATKRMAATLVAAHCEEITSPEVISTWNDAMAKRREQAHLGRPTKRDRRKMEDFGRGFFD